MTGLTMTVCLRLAHAARLCWSGLRSHVSRFWPEVRGICTASDRRHQRHPHRPEHPRRTKRHESGMAFVGVS